MHGLTFTGCGSTGLTLCKNKGISKKILGYHRIRVPDFTVIVRGRRGVRPARLKFPILVKPLKEESSHGIARLQVLPIRELVFKEVPPDEPKIATYRAKWDEEYRKRWGLENQFAEGLDPAVVRNLEQTCKRIYRLLTIDGYARLDLRLTSQNELCFIEANPNPILASDEDFAQSALKAGLSYPQLIERVIRVGRNTVRD